MGENHDETPASASRAGRGEVVAWQWRCSANGVWSDWEIVKYPIEQWRESFAGQVERGTVEARPLYAGAQSFDAGRVAGQQEVLDSLRHQADSAYCKYLDKMSERECLGEDAKIRTGSFGKEELNAHRAARELYGIHVGIHRALAAIASLPLVESGKDGCCKGLAPTADCRCEQERKAAGYPPYHRGEGVSHPSPDSASAVADKLDRRSRLGQPTLNPQEVPVILAALRKSSAAREALEWVRSEIFGLCEATENACHNPPAEIANFSRGRAFEAKGIRNAMGEVIRERLAALAATKAEAAPVAWHYELAGAVTNSGKYALWQTRITKDKPNVPDGSIRNLTPLYARPPAPVAEVREALEPFAKIADLYDDRDDDAFRIIADRDLDAIRLLTLGNCRKARSALKGGAV